LLGKERVAWFIHCIRHYAQFSGRASRPEFWWFTLVIQITGLVSRFAIPRSSVVGSIVIVLFDLGVITPHLAVTSRRLHDSGHSFWYAAPACIGMPILLVASSAISQVDAAFVIILYALFALVTLGFTVLFLCLLCFKSDKGFNRFGRVAPAVPE